ncbi:hypothetical protein Dsin_033119 [Dipteronia sinensis]|uniref:Hydrophobic seed protein domain-containing protein n=1 Tax=Dipteronia sinensis TaxID=43782 RepID=A0AAD9Z2F6_9ROSI|nr:hypothetical protein Dsin_000168 [Dipteronia sinensis]KAK3175621.1 hypothetical protein Dsin_033119 [Dipteronia sinensis]
MGSKALASTALLLSLNLLFFSLVSSYCPSGTCLDNTPNLDVCVELLGGLLNLKVNSPQNYGCCSLITNLVDVNVAACLCTRIKLELPILEEAITIPLSLNLLFKACGRPPIPCAYKCP